MENTPKTKICVSCKNNININNFSKNKANKSGYFGKCKSCSNTTRELYRKTKKGLIGEIYSMQKYNSSKRNYPFPTYSKKWLETYMMGDKKFHELYHKWEASRYEKDLRPSIDRINDYQSYTIENIQIMTYGENRDKFFDDLQNRVNRKPLKKVIQYGIDGSYIKEFISIRDAEVETKCHNSKITAVCKGRRKTTGGFIWRYKNEAL